MNPDDAYQLGVGNPRTINTFDQPDASCPCVTDHNPNAVQLHVHHIWPLGLGGPDEPANEMVVCPTTHAKVHRLIREAVRDGVAVTDLPWSIRQAMGRFAVDLAQDGWAQWQERTEAGLVVASAGVND